VSVSIDVAGEAAKVEAPPAIEVQDLSASYRSGSTLRTCGAISGT
jgi:hypothetical protein